MNRIRLVLAGIVLLGVVSTAAAQDAVKLVRTPKVGEQVIFETKTVLDIGGNKVTVTDKVTEEIVKVEENGEYQIKCTYWDIKTATTAGEAEQTWNPDTTVFKPKGEFVRVVGEKVPASSARLANLNALVLPDAPVKIGDTWKHVVVADAKTGAVAATSEYKVVAREKVGEFDCLAVEHKYRETEGDLPTSCEGKIWIDVATGVMVKREAVVRSLPTSFASVKQSVNGTMSVTRYVPPKMDATPTKSEPPKAG